MPLPDGGSSLIAVPGWDERLISLRVCPYWLLSQPAVSQVFRAYNWMDKGQMALAFPNPCSPLIAAVDALTKGIDKGRAESMDKEDRDREIARASSGDRAR